MSILTGKTKARPAENPAPAPTGPRGPVLPPAPVLPTPRRERRRLLIVGGLLVAILSGMAVYFVSQKAADRVDVVGVASDVAWGERITADDLQRVQVVADPGLRPVSWSTAQSMVGKVAAVDLRAGSLLTATSVTDAAVPGAGEALVGLALKSGQMPGTALRPGDRVQLVTLPDQASGAEPPAPVPARVYRVGGALTGGSYPVDVIVPQSVSAAMGITAAQGRVVVVLYPRG